MLRVIERFTKSLRVNNGVTLKYGLGRMESFKVIENGTIRQIDPVRVFIVFEVKRDIG